VNDFEVDGDVLANLGIDSHLARQLLRKILTIHFFHTFYTIGTPIMNNLRELWSLFDFATSGKILGPQKR
jgi:SNF2 family DNA or RNA helicase